MAKKILVLYRLSHPLPAARVAIRQHIQALSQLVDRCEVIYANAVLGMPAWVRRVRFDGIVLHTTFLGMRWSPSFREWKEGLDWIGSLDCAKVALPQDEYDHAAVLDSWLAQWGVQTVFSCFGEEMWPILYPTLHGKARFVPCLTGYLLDGDAERIAAKCRPLSERPFDIVYRASKLPYWFGSHGQLKHEIAGIVREAAGRAGLRCDISTRPEDTIMGDRWFDFLASGRVVIGCESGSSVLDRDGGIMKAIEAMEAANPSLAFADVQAAMPEGWDDYRFFAISPRHLEVVLTKTAQVLVEGSYSGVLEADRHFIPLRRDFSNLQDVMERVKDTAALAEMAERAYEDILLGGKYTYRKFAEEILTAVPDRPVDREYRRAGSGLFLEKALSLRGMAVDGIVSARDRIMALKRIH